MLVNVNILGGRGLYGARAPNTPILTKQLCKYTLSIQLGFIHTFVANFRGDSTVLYTRVIPRFTMTRYTQQCITYDPPYPSEVGDNGHVSDRCPSKVRFHHLSPGLFQLLMKLNTTGITEFYVYLHAKDYFVPYESGTRKAIF